MILAIRTDSERAELYLFDAEGTRVASKCWQAGRKLSKQILTELTKLLTRKKVALNHLSGVIAYRGPGSFTALRIGISVANTLAYSSQIPIVGSSGTEWITNGLRLLPKARVGELVLPKYGAPPHITKPKK